MIIKVVTITSNDADNFHDRLVNTLSLAYELGYSPEVQYSVCHDNYNKVSHSALLLLKKEDRV